MTAPAAPSLGFWLKCRKCAHCWIAAYLPMDVTTFCKATRGARCPKCADGKPVVAKQEGGSLMEPGS